MALSISRGDAEQAVLCELGDGATNIGAWHESLNLAGVWRLPIVYLVMNNVYGMGTSVERASAEPELYKRAASYRMRGERIDGNDLEAVIEASEELLANARRDREPAVLELMTYRYRGHSVADAGLAYRTKDEISEHRAEDDPIELLGPQARRARARRRGRPRGAPGEGQGDGEGRGRVRRGQRRARRRLARRARLRGPGVPGAVRADAAGQPVRGDEPGLRAGARVLSGETETMTYREALRLALAEELRRDERVFLMGEEVGVFEGSYKVTAGLLDEFGEDRIRDTPISEEGFVGAAVGAAMAGQRPVVEIMTLNFILIAMDQVVNHAAKIRYMFGGEAGCPLVIRTPNGAGNQLTAQHSQSFEGWFAHVPGLKVVAPSNPRDAKGLLKAAIRDEDPVLVIENLPIYKEKGEVPVDEDFTTPIGRAEIAREGTDLTIVSHSYATVRALKVAEQLASEHEVEAEVVDLRSLRPLDVETVAESVARTNRVLCVEEGWPSYGVTAEIAARVQHACFDDLDAPVERVGMAEVPMPYAKNLENATLPGEDKVLAAALATLDMGPRQ